MIEGLAKAYRETTDALGAKIAPVGLAFHEVSEARPDLRLHGDDGSHPSPSGTYLAACVLYGTITGRDPRGVGNGGLDISAETRTFLQNVAWSVLEEERSRAGAATPK